MSILLPSRLSGTGGFSKGESPTFTLVTQVDIDSRRYRSPCAHWPYEEPEKKSLFDTIVEHWLLEAIVSTCVATDLILTGITFVASEEIAESDTIFYMSAVLLCVLLMDVVLRMIKDGCAFFIKALNWLEVIVCIGGAVMLIMDGIGRLCTGPDCNSGGSQKGASLGRAVRPLMRIFRVLRAMSHIVGSQSGITSKVDRYIDQKTDSLIRDVLGDLLVVPPDNITMKATEGQFHLEKAQVRPSVFSNLHLPFTIVGGLIDFMHFDIDIVQSTKARKNNPSGHRLLIIIENVLLVVGPGHHQEQPAPPWDYQAVLQTKKKLIDLIATRLQQTQFLWGKVGGGGEDASSGTQGGGKKKKKDGAVAKWAKAKMKKAAAEVLAHGMHASIRNVEIRYEDARGELSGGPVVIGGFEIGSVQMRAQGVGEETFETEEHFRVKGKWRPGAGARHEEGPSPTKTESLRSSGSRSSGTKATFDQGIRAALHVENIAAFWDLHEASFGPEKAGAYGSHLQENENVSVLSFLTGIQKKRARERVKLAVLGQVEKDFVLGEALPQQERVRGLSKVGENELYSRSAPRLTKAEGKAAVERMRRLKEKVAGHRYLVMPCGCSVHAVYRPPRAPSEGGLLQGYSSESSSWMTRGSDKVAKVMSKTVTDEKGQGFWPPQTDIDVHIPCIPFSVDVAQARSMVGLLDYLKRWKIEDHRIMWLPSPHHSGFHSAFARWGYALRMVLSSIDERYPWHSLGWVEMRRRARLTEEYGKSLIADEPEEDLVAMLQVGLPLQECILQHIAAAKFKIKRGMENKKRRRKKAPTKAKRDSSFGATDSMGSVDSAEEVDEATQQARDMRGSYRDVVKAVKEIKQEIHLPAHLRSFQFQLCIKSLQVLVLGPVLGPEPLRRPLIRFEVSGIYLVASAAAPQAIWMRLAPPIALATVAKREEWPEGFAAEVALEDIRAVFCGVPSTASTLRRLVGPPRLTGKAYAGTSRVVAGDGDWDLRRLASEVGSPGVLNRYADRFFAMGRLAFVGKEQAEVAEEGTIRPKIPRWDFSAWTFPLEVHLCQPLMKQILTNFKRREHVPRWYSTSHESRRFWEELKLLRDIHNNTTIKREKKARRAELATGITGPLVGSRVTGEVLMRGGMLGSQLVVYSEATWLRRAGTVPAGRLKIDRVVDGGPQLKVGFLPSAPSSSHVQFQSADGWWFAAEAEAQEHTRLVTGDGTPCNVEDLEIAVRQEESWAGNVAHEDPDRPQESQGSLWKLPRHVMRDWGLNPDGSLRSRYKPPVSAKGLLPLALPEKRRSGSSMGFAVDCCRSLERNIPDPMKPALMAIAVAMPEDGLTACCASPAPAAPAATGPGRPPVAPAEAQTLPLISPDVGSNYPAPSFTPDNTTREGTEKTKADSLSDPSKAKAALEAERKSPAQELFSLSEMDVTLEVLSAKSVGLPNPSVAGLLVWWRSLGVVVE